MFFLNGTQGKYWASIDLRLNVLWSASYWNIFGRFLLVWHFSQLSVGVFNDRREFLIVAGRF
jgi:hypothetical protein